MPNWSKLSTLLSRLAPVHVPAPKSVLLGGDTNTLSPHEKTGGPSLSSLTLPASWRSPQVQFFQLVAAEMGVRSELFCTVWKQSSILADEE